MNVEGVVAIAQRLVWEPTIQQYRKMMSELLMTSPTKTIGGHATRPALLEPDVLSLTLLYETNNQQVVNALPASIRSTVMRHANGEVKSVKVVEITPLRVVLMVCNSLDTTDPIRTPSTTTQETSTESATTVTTVGTQPTTQTTTRTSRSNTNYKKPRLCKDCTQPFSSAYHKVYCDV